ncbi:MAG: type II toxin-antitoxin system RelE/ParE family toxin [ANME-2 cluster archaeon]|nr:type II toxin-antitoxin system RelE/ParE family toxin [ANME-2 cluster archaeon]
MYNVVFTRRSLKDLENIDKYIQNRIAVKLKEYTKEPQKHGKKLINHKIGTYRFKIGDYRIIFDIDKDTIVVLRIGHRKGIYK